MSQKLKPEWEAFLGCIEKWPNVRWASKKAGVHFSSVYRKVSVEPEFAARFKESWQIGCGFIRDVANEGVTLGWKEPVIYKGQYQFYVDPRDGKTKMVTVRKRPERLMMKILSGEFPEVFNVNRMEHTGPNGGPIEGKIQIEFVKPKKSDK